MNLNLDNTQEMIQKEARRFFAAELDSEKVRDIETSADGFMAQQWAEMAKLGWNDVALPESVGGGGLGIVELCVLAEEMGRAAASTPLIVSCGLAASFLQSIPESPRVNELLTMLATSDGVLTAALVEETGRDERTQPSLLLQEDPDGGTLSGSKLLVPYASIAKVMLVSLRASNGEPIVAAIDGGATGLTTTRHRTIGGDPLFQVHFDKVRVSNERILARGDTAIAALDACLDVATVLAMAEAVGYCEGIIRLTAEYAKERKQFGKAIGSYQAVSHPIADMRIQTDACRMLAREAAWLLDQGRSAIFEIASAKAFANEAIAKIIIDGQRLHGAIGYSNEYDLQLFTRRARAFCSAYSDTEGQLERAAVALGL